MRFWLKHRNDIVALLDIDVTSGKIVHAEIIRKESLPFLGAADIQKLRQWWHMRGIPKLRSDYLEILFREGCVNSEQMLIKHIGISANDTCHCLIKNETNKKRNSEWLLFNL